MIYLALSLAFLTVACIVAIIAISWVGGNQRRRLVRQWSLPLAITAIALIILTAIFDNIMIAAGFMVYSDSHVTGLAIGRAPLEDFSYPLAGLILLPALWLLFRRRQSDDARE